MSHSSPRNRIASGAVLGAALLILPLTASISYAASETAQEVPEPPAPPPPPEAPDAPQPPEAPEAPKVFMFKSGDADGDITLDLEGEPGTNVIVKERVERGPDGKEHKVRIVRRLAPGQDALSEAEHAEMEKALREGLAEADRELAQMPRLIEEALAEAEAANAEAARAGAKARVIVRRECAPGGTEPTQTTQSADGVTTVAICERRVYASARNGLLEARDEIARNRDIPEDTRKRILKDLDRTIAQWRDKEG